MLDEAKADRIESVIAEMWPETIDPQQIGEAGPGLEEGDVICASYWSG